MPTLVVGLTGNVASGKSTVRRMLVERGAAALDADALVHSLYRPGAEGTAAVAREFGHDILAADGSVDRAKLAARTMGDAAATARLEAIVHPLVQSGIEEWIAAERAAGDGRADLHLAVVEATLTFEAGTDGRHDVMVFVDAARDLRRARAGMRGMPPEEFDRREGRLMPPDAKRRRSRFTVDNDGDEAALAEAVDELVRRLSVPGSRG